MKYLLLILIASFLSCNAQTLSLEAATQCDNDPNCPNYTYAKDINNSLQKFLETWKGNLNGKIYEFKFNKGLFEMLGDKRDRLLGRLRITDSNGNILYNTFNETDDQKTKFRGLNFTSDLQSYMLQFSGPPTNGCINRGTVYLDINLTDPNKMSIIYLSDYDITKGECPSSFTSTIPEKQRIYLTKQ